MHDSLGLELDRERMRHAKQLEETRNMLADAHMKLNLAIFDVDVSQEKADRASKRALIRRVMHQPLL